MEANEQISEITLPKTAKLLFCAICLLYDCNQHNMDEKAGEVTYLFYINFLAELHIRFKKQYNRQKTTYNSNIITAKISS